MLQLKFYSFYRLENNVDINITLQNAIYLKSLS